MMLSNFKSGYPDDKDSSDGQLLSDIEEICKALYLDHETHQSSFVSSSNLRPKSAKKSHFFDLKSKSGRGFDDNDGWLSEEKKPSSIWGWKPFKALSHIRRRKFNCFFFCHVHCVKNLPSDFDDASMSVHWKRKGDVLRTLPSKISNGVVEFEETLTSKCAINCFKSGPGNFVKYDSKSFLLYASTVEAGGLDIGKHWIDLTRLLPLTIEELEEDRCSGKWSTSFKLAGKAKGATLHVSFAFLVTKDDLAEFASNMKLPVVLNIEKNGLNRMNFVTDVGLGKGNTTLRHGESVPSSFTNASSISSQGLDKFGWPRDPSDYLNSINVLYKKLEEGNIDPPVKFDGVLEHLESLKLAPDSFSCSAKDIGRAECDDCEHTIIEKEIAIEQSPEEEIKLDVSAVELDVSSVEVIDVAEIFKGEGISFDEETNFNGKDEVSSFVANDTLIDKQSVTKEPNTEKELFDSHRMVVPESAELDSSLDEISNEIKVNYRGSKMVKSLSLDDVTKAVADDFVNLLQGVHTTSALSSCGNLESPRERLLREFEEDMMISGSFFLDVDVQEDEFDTDHAAPIVSPSDFDIEGMGILPVIDTAGQKSSKQLSKSKMKAQLVECLETQSLMQRWGLNEEAFQSSAHYSTGGFGSPIFVPPVEPVGLPSLAEGLESLVQLKDGGLLRSMNPLLFQNTKNCGSLVLQASKPVVLPAELGSNITVILQCIASVGIQRLSEKVHQLMPLAELSGKIMQQLVWDASCKEEVLERPVVSQHESDVKIEVEGSSHIPGCSYSNSSPTVSDMALGYIFVKDIAPLALDSIETLLIEGLKMQSGMSAHNAPFCIRVKSASEVNSRSRIAYSNESSDLLGVGGTANYVDELLDFSISLEEWLRLDAGTFSDESLVDEHTLKVLAAHHAKPSYCSNRKLGGEDNTQNETGKRGFFGDDLTIALMIQLRDPLRNYEPAGSPMLALIQVERASRSVSEADYPRSSELMEEMDRKMDSVKEGQGGVPRFTVNEVHVAGLNAETGLSEFWASRRQQQAGLRWLLASGLSKNHNSHISKLESITSLSTRVLRNTWPQNLLWSISRLTCSVGVDPLEFSAKDLLSRNPDIVFPEEAV